MVMLDYGIAGFLAWLFATAGWHKLYEPAQYSMLIGQYLPALPGKRWLVYPVALVELALAILLLLPATRPAGGLAAAALLVAYAGLMGWQLAMGRRDIRCGCGGPASRVTISPSLVLRNLLCAAGALLLAFPAGGLHLTIPAIGLVLFVAGFLILLYLCSEQLIANSQKMAGSK